MTTSHRTTASDVTFLVYAVVLSIWQLGAAGTTIFYTYSSGGFGGPHLHTILAVTFSNTIGPIVILAAYFYRSGAAVWLIGIALVHLATTSILTSLGNGAVFWIMLVLYSGFAALNISVLTYLTKRQELRHP